MKTLLIIYCVSVPLYLFLVVIISLFAEFLRLVFPSWRKRDRYKFTLCIWNCRRKNRIGDGQLITIEGLVEEMNSYSKLLKLYGFTRDIPYEMGWWNQLVNLSV